MIMVTDTGASGKNTNGRILFKSARTCLLNLTALYRKPTPTRPIRAMQHSPRFNPKRPFLFKVRLVKFKVSIRLPPELSAVLAMLSVQQYIGADLIVLVMTHANVFKDVIRFLCREV